MKCGIFHKLIFFNFILVFYWKTELCGGRLTTVIMQAILWNVMIICLIEKAFEHGFSWMMQVTLAKKKELISSHI